MKKWHLLEEKFRWHLEGFASELFTYYNINKGNSRLLEKILCNYTYYAINGNTHNKV